MTLIVKIATGVSNRLNHVAVSNNTSMTCTMFYISGLKTLDFTFKTYTVSVPLTVESTYHSDGYCLVPDKYDVLDLYTDEITNHRDSDLVNWTGVMDAAIKDDGLIHAFERALCKAVQEVQPYLSVRERVCGWCGTAWQSLDEFISHLS